MHDRLARQAWLPNPRQPTDGFTEILGVVGKVLPDKVNWMHHQRETCGVGLGDPRNEIVAVDGDTGTVATLLVDKEI